jgi:DNA recombination protein RmuC
MAEAALLAALAALALAVWMLFRVQRTLEEKHRQMLADLHDGLVRQSDRVGASIDGLREAVAAKLDARLDQISNRVNERLDEGFRKTNDTFVNVMQRLSTIDEAQKKIETLTGSVVQLHELLGDKTTARRVRRGAARGAGAQHAAGRGVRDAVHARRTAPRRLRAQAPAPTGMVCVDSKFPLENYNRMFDRQPPSPIARAAQRLFKADVKRHVDDIARKYIVAGETSDGAVMFLPAEAVFAEIHAYHAEVVEYANTKRVWIVSPTTLMAVLNTARAVLKDVETRKQVDVIKDALGRLALEFGRFDERLRKLAEHMRAASPRIAQEDHRPPEEKISRSSSAASESAELEEKAGAGERRYGSAEERKSPAAEGSVLSYRVELRITAGIDIVLATLRIAAGETERTRSRWSIPSQTAIIATRVPSNPGVVEQSLRPHSAPLCGNTMLRGMRRGFGRHPRFRGNARIARWVRDRVLHSGASSAGTPAHWQVSAAFAGPCPSIIPSAEYRAALADSALSRPALTRTPGNA